MLTIVVPMAGRGSRFAKEGYKNPKPLIDVLGKPMIEWVINNIKPKCEHQFIFIVQKEHCLEFGIDKTLKEIEPSSKVVEINGVTEGALCTVLESRSILPVDGPLMIANSDQFIDFSIEEYLAFSEVNNLDGLIMTMDASDPKWSFVELKESKVIRVVEKEVISNEATVGIYNFKSIRKFLIAADEMIASNERVNGEFYVAPVYNNLIKNGDQIGYFNIGSEYSGMYGLGIPSDLNKFLDFEVSSIYKNKYFNL